MGSISWILPMILSLVSSGVQTGVSAYQANKQLEAQQNNIAQQKAAEEKALNIQKANNYINQLNNNQTIADNYRNAMGTNSLSSGTAVNSTGIGVQGLNGQMGYLNEEDQTNYKCGGRRKRAFGGKNKVDNASIYVSPNNMRVKSDSNNVVNYRDRLAQFKLGGRKC